MNAPLRPTGELAGSPASRATVAAAQRGDSEPARSARGALQAVALLTLVLFAANAWRLRFLGDDGYIAFRFARNLVQGHGLVFNPGERVEGYTQPLWVLLMALGMRLGIAPEVASQALGLACGAALLLALFAYSLTKSPPVSVLDAWLCGLAPLCLAVNRTFCAWSTGGLGTQMFALLVFSSLARFDLARARARPSWLAVSGLFLLTCWARPEGLLVFSLALAFLALDVARRRRGAAEWARFAVPCAIGVVAHFLWRHAYYGQWLPNTFYAKVSGFWPSQGWIYLRLFAGEHVAWLWPVLLAPLAFALPPGDPRRSGVRLFALACAAWSAYLLAIGGDRFEFRFLTPVLPLLCWLCQVSLRSLAARARHARGMLARGLAPVGAMCALASTGLSSLHPFQAAQGVNSLEEISAYAERRAESGRFLRRLVAEGYLAPETLLALRGVGALPYHSGLPTLDLHGLNDARIAHAPVTQRGVVSHEKSASVEYVRERGVVMCNVLNYLVFDGGEPQFANVMRADFQRFPAYFPPPVRCVRALGKFLVFGTTLSEPEFRRAFARFEIVR